MLQTFITSDAIFVAFLTAYLKMFKLFYGLKRSNSSSSLKLNQKVLRSYMVCNSDRQWKKHSYFCFPVQNYNDVPLHKHQQAFEMFSGLLPQTTALNFEVCCVITHFNLCKQSQINMQIIFFLFLNMNPRCEFSQGGELP